MRRECIKSMEAFFLPFRLVPFIIPNRIIRVFFSTHSLTHSLNSQNEWKNIPYYFSYSILTVKFGVTDLLRSRSLYVFILFLFSFSLLLLPPPPRCYCCYISYFCSVWRCRHMYGIFRTAFFSTSLLILRNARHCRVSVTFSRQLSRE